MTKKINIHSTKDKSREYDKNTTLLRMAENYQQDYDTTIVAAKVDNVVKDLQEIVTKDSWVEFMDLRSLDGSRTYQRSLFFLLQMAVSELFPNGRLSVEHSLGKGIYCEVYVDGVLEKQDVELLEQRMKHLVEQNIKIEKRTMPIEQAIALFEKSGQMEKVRLLKQVNRKNIHLYFCGEAYDYFFGPLVPSTGYLSVFSLEFYSPGLVILFPASENPHLLPSFVPQPKLFAIYRETENWGRIMECGFVGTLNKFIRKGKAEELVRISEALHEKKTAQIADFIAHHTDKVRLILVAGPSSSGKTTFAQRLYIQLRVNGVKPVPISLDDYFVNREATPKDAMGEYDFESIEALDLELFNKDLVALLALKPVEIPTYNFLTGKREYNGHVIQLSKEQPLIIEGIHGLNERLTESIVRENKIKVYISALTQLSLDSHNRIPTTDARLIRRLVRDMRYRGHNALQTLKMWASVRRGEDNNIFPFQEEADIMFNSALIYELAVLKKYAQPLLEKVNKDVPEYSEARRLINFLEHFNTLDDAAIPANSILREFIGTK